MKTTFIAVLLTAVGASSLSAQAPRQKVTISYQAAGSTTWPIFIAKEAGYFDKYGLEVTPVLAAFPGGVAMLVKGDASMTIGGLQQLLPAAAADGSLIAVGTVMNRSTFVLVASQNIASIQQLKGKKIAVSQVGDALYGYLTGFLRKHGLAPRDVELVSMGNEPARRAAALASGRVDATLLSVPLNFRMEAEGFRTLAALAEDDDVYTTAAFWVRRSTLQGNRDMIEKLLRAHGEAVARFYSDKKFAVDTYLKYDKLANRQEWERAYDLIAKYNMFERVPVVTAAAMDAAIEHQVDAVKLTPAQRQAQRRVVDNSIVEKIQRER